MESASQLSVLLGDAAMASGEPRSVFAVAGRGIALRLLERANVYPRAAETVNVGSRAVKATACLLEIASVYVEETYVVLVGMETCAALQEKATVLAKANVCTPSYEALVSGTDSDFGTATGDEMDRGLLRARLHDYPNRRRAVGRGKSLGPHRDCRGSHLAPLRRPVVLHVRVGGSRLGVGRARPCA